MINIMTPKEVTEANNPIIDTICEQINLKLLDGNRNFTIHNNINITDGHINFIKARLMKAGWKVHACKITCDDRPCSSPYLEVHITE